MDYYSLLSPREWLRISAACRIHSIIWKGSETRLYHLHIKPIWGFRYGVCDCFMVAKIALMIMQDLPILFTVPNVRRFQSIDHPVCCISPSCHLLCLTKIYSATAFAAFLLCGFLEIGQEMSARFYTLSRAWLTSRTKSQWKPVQLRWERFRPRPVLPYDPTWIARDHRCTSFTYSLWFPLTCWSMPSLFD